MVTIDLQLKKTLNRTRTIDGVSQTLNSENYTAGTQVTVDLSSVRLERTYQNKPISIQRAVSKSRYSVRDPKNILYDFKKIFWKWKIRGTYSSTSYTNVHNFVTDCKLIFEDGGTFTLTFQDKEYTLIAQLANFIHEGGTIHKVSYLFTFIEGQERS